MPKIKIPEYIKNILNRLCSNGYESYMVGGCVRDLLLGRRIHDWDITTSAPPDVVMKLFPKTVPTGLKYGTVTVFHKGSSAEVTTFRTDGSYADGRRPESVDFVSSLSADLSRRDFTVNAMAMDVSGKITDLFCGIEDLSKKVIRCVGDPEIRFHEDALRMFRAIRFSAQLGFEIDPETQNAIIRSGSLAAYLSAERILAESTKILMSPRPEYICRALQFGLFNTFITGTPDYPSLYKIKKIPSYQAMRLCAFAVFAEGDFIRGAELLKRIAAPASAVKLCREAEKINCFSHVDTNFALHVHNRDAVLCACGINDIINHGSSLSYAKKLIRENAVFPLAVNGKDLLSAGISPGEHMGEILSMLTRHICEYPEDNAPDILLKLALNMNTPKPLG